MKMAMELKAGGRQRLILRWLSFFVSYLIGLVAFISFSSSKFVLPLKSRFSLTQTQADCLVSMLFVGMTATIPTGFLIQRHGTRFGAALASGVSFTSYSLIALGCANPQFFVDKYWLLVLLFFMGGCSQGTVYLLTVRSGLQNFSDRNKSAINGLLQTSNSIGPILINVFYDVYFSVTLTTGYLEGFFGCIACTAGAFCFIGVFAFGDYHEQPHEEEKLLDGPEQKCESSVYGSYRDVVHEILTESNNEIEKEDVEHAKINEDLSVWETLTNLTFFVIMAQSLALGVGAANASQAVVYATSLGLDQYGTIIPYVGVVFGLFFKPAFGLFSSFCNHRIPLNYYLVLSLMLTIGTLLLSIFFLDHLSMLIINQLAMDAVTGIGVCVLPVITATEFGMKAFSRNWGIIICVWGIGCFAFESIFGVVYDSHIEIEGSTSCYGLHCFSLSFLVAIIYCALIMYPVVAQARNRKLGHRHIANDK